jgi:hypothetical protein
MSGIAFTPAQKRTQSAAITTLNAPSMEKIQRVIVYKYLSIKPYQHTLIDDRHGSYCSSSQYSSDSDDGPIQTKILNGEQHGRQSKFIITTAGSDQALIGPGLLANDHGQKLEQYDKNCLDDIIFGNKRNRAPSTKNLSLILALAILLCVQNAAPCSSFSDYGGNTGFSEFYYVSIKHEFSQPIGKITRAH